ncbi:MFS transporter [Sutcliffiella horikoshii]|uniref:MFS transporter n=1 Tax=Sutcliffiella horikoshii TaxID=79883 RepID=A0A5D4T373_9BACI|nr:MFS transporter [Sutcliffiella horikoshii]TYS69088.1 MFS transporter [Sutcliffiella horikoshii]
MGKHKLFLYTKALSDFGSFMDLIVLNVVVYAATGSPVWLAATMAARTIGGVLASLVSGVAADKWNRKTIMLVTDILRAGLILLLIPFPDPVMILVVSALIGFISSFFMVSFSAEVPQIFGQDKILETNSLIARLTSISLVTGFIGAGVITEVLGYKYTLIIDAGTYLLSGFVLWRMKWDATAAKKNKEIVSGFRNNILSVFRDTREVYRYLKLAPMLLMINVVFLVGAFAGSSHNLGIPLLAEQINGDRQSFYYGMIWGVWGIGSVLGTYTIPKLKIIRSEKIFSVFFLSAMFMSLGFIIFLSNTIVSVILIFAFFTGIFDACFTTLHASILQKSENYIRGRVFAVGMLLKSLGFALGFVVAPILLKGLTMPQMVLILHGTLITTSLVILIVAGNWSNKKRQNAALT